MFGESYLQASSGLPLHEYSGFLKEWCLEAPYPVSEEHQLQFKILNHVNIWISKEVLKNNKKTYSLSFNEVLFNYLNKSYCSVFLKQWNLEMRAVLTHLLLCIQSNKDSCLWEWTIDVSRFSLFLLKERSKQNKKWQKLKENRHCSTKSPLWLQIFYNFLNTLSVHTSW